MPEQTLFHSPMTDRPSTTLLHLTPHLLARMEALGFVPGSEGALPWLVALAEELRRAEAAALYLPEGGADLGFLMPEAGLWWKPVDDGSIEIEDFTRCTHPDGKPFRRAHYRNGETLSSSFHATPRAAMRAETP